MKTGTYRKVDASVRNEEREKIFDSFRDEHNCLNHLLANRVINEGIDLPIANTVILHESVSNLRILIQRFGRALRVWNNDRSIITTILIFLELHQKRELNKLITLINEIETEQIKRTGFTKIVSVRKAYKDDNEPSDTIPIQAVPQLAARRT